MSGSDWRRYRKKEKFGHFLRAQVFVYRRPPLAPPPAAHAKGSVKSSGKVKLPGPCKPEVASPSSASLNRPGRRRRRRPPGPRAPSPQSHRRQRYLCTGEPVPRLLSPERCCLIAVIASARRVLSPSVCLPRAAAFVAAALG